MPIVKVIVSNNVCVNGEWLKKEREFKDLKEASDYIASQDMVYKFVIQLIKRKVNS